MASQFTERVTAESSMQNLTTNPTYSTYSARIVSGMSDVPNNLKTMSLYERILIKLIRDGYQYLVFDNTESCDINGFISHYTAYKIIDNHVALNNPFPIDSERGEMAISELADGSAVLYLYTGTTLTINTNGSLIEKDHFQKFTI